MSRLAVVLLLSLGTVPAATAEHLLPAADAHERLADAARDRQQRIAAVNALLDAPEAARVSQVTGISIAQAKSGVATLSDADLSDLSQRAQALRSDPAAGSDGLTFLAGMFVGGVLLFLLLVILFATQMRD